MESVEVTKIADSMIEKRYESREQFMDAFAAQSTEIIMQGLMDMVVRAPDAFNMIFEKANDLVKMKLESEHLQYVNDNNLIANILNSFNENVRQTLSGIDLKDARTVENFERLCDSFRSNLLVSYTPIKDNSQTHQRSLWKMIFGRNH